MKIEIDGECIRAESDFHKSIADALHFGACYGKNLDALHDVLSADVERPVVLVWKKSNVSKESMGETFDRIVKVLRGIERQDADWGLVETFKLLLE